MGLNRKAYPSLRRQNGMRFPHGKIAAIAYPGGSLLAQNQRSEFVLAIHHVVGAGGLQLCSAAEAPGDAGALKAGIVTGQNIDIGIACTGDANPPSPIFTLQSIYVHAYVGNSLSMCSSMTIDCEDWISNASFTC